MAKWRKHFSQLLNGSEINKLINSIWNKEELPEEWELLIVPIYKEGDKTECSNYRGISLSSTAYKILSNILLSKLSPYAEKCLGDHQVDFNSIFQLLIIYSAVVKYLRTNGNTVKQCISFQESS